MKKVVLIAFTILATLGYSSAKAQMVGGRVINVKDGDSVDMILSNGIPIQVRLANIDAPELDQPMGVMAKAFLSNFALGKFKRVIISGRDQYGRYIGNMEGDQTWSINYLLVKNGLAWHYKQYSNDIRYAQAEQQAQAQRAGLWGGGIQPVAPWVWRQRKSQLMNNYTTGFPRLPFPNNVYTPTVRYPVSNVIRPVSNTTTKSRRYPFSFPGVGKQQWQR